MGFLLATVPPAFQHLYAPARRTLHQHITDLAHRRTDVALTRIRRGGLPTFAEYDLFYGLTGIGPTCCVPSRKTPRCKAFCATSSLWPAHSPPEVAVCPDGGSAGQLAGIALRATGIQDFYEDALYRALNDSGQLAHITDNGLCHGWAGIYQTATRAAADSRNNRLHLTARRIGDILVAQAQPDAPPAAGLLNGAAGTALALSTLASQRAPTTGWDACLLIN